METRAGAQISQKSFIQSVVILLILMLLAGLLTWIVPSGQYARSEQDGRTVIQPDTFAFTEKAGFPVWRWFTAPFEVLGQPDGLTLIVIMIFLLMVGTAFAVLDKSGIVKAGLGLVVIRFGDQKYTLLLVVIFFFMCLGAFFGIFEEVVPLVPLTIALSYSLGWDSMVGLGMSILATNVGFSAAITNPFTIGVSQKLAELPLFSGSALRLFVFAACYAALAIFLTRYARRIERTPQASPVYAEDQKERSRYAHVDFTTAAPNLHLSRSLAWLAVFLVLILAVLVAAPLLPGLSDYALPLVGLLFFLGGVVAGFFSGMPARPIFKAMAEGAIGIAPAIPLILMAASVKHIVAAGGIMDTMLYYASGLFANTSPFAAAMLIYGIALLVEFFIGSGSAKAVLLMPILLPLADIVGVTRQVSVTAYCFGDGFSNLAYPTNPVLLICLGLTVVSYPKWIRWLAGMWAWVILITVAFLAVATAIHYGPF